MKSLTLAMIATFALSFSLPAIAQAAGLQDEASLTGDKKRRKGGGHGDEDLRLSLR